MKCHVFDVTVPMPIRLDDELAVAASSNTPLEPIASQNEFPGLADDAIDQITWLAAVIGFTVLTHAPTVNG
jgi:hypothetical protein